MKKSTKKIRQSFAILIILAMMAALLPATAFAAGSPVGTVTASGFYREYTSLSDLIRKVQEFKNKSVTIEMESDWGDQQLCIPKGSHVTLNMNGHMYNRGLSDYKRYGEVIRIEDKATLVINGGEGGPHKVKIWSGSTSYKKVHNNVQKDFQGGVIAGGFSSTGAGGIDMYGADVRLYLNNVTIAGCRAAQTWGTDGYGGGIWVHGGISEAGSIVMNNSTITGCYATNDGGGIHQNNHNNFTLEMHASHIDGNLCGGEGGGISISGEDINIKGDGKSTVSGNQSDSSGGGIYLWNDDVTVTGLTISGNRSGYNGGGIFTLEEGIQLTNLTITENEADQKGGGIYIENDSNILSNLTVLKNQAGVEGGGIWVEGDVDTGFQLNGKCIVKENLMDGKDANNLTLKDNSCRLSLGLMMGSDVHMSYAFLPSKDWVLVTPGSTGDDGKGQNTTENKASNCIRYLTSDRDEWQFTFNSAPNYRKIFYVKKGGKGIENTGNPHVLKPSEYIDPIREGMEPAGKEVQGKQGTYPLMRGYFRSPALESSEDRAKAFYYSDGFFDSDPFQYNEHLATASLSMAMAGCFLNYGGYGSKADYTNKHAGGRQFMADIGCDDQRIYVNDFNLTRAYMDTMGVTIASKEILLGSDAFTLIPVVVRSAGYEMEWTSNVTIGDGSLREGEAQGFSDAAEIVLREIKDYLRLYELEQDAADGKVIFWLAGYSRGGATCNLTGRRLREQYHNAKLFDYTFAAPQGGSNNATKLDDEEYFCIHNVINKADLVPYVAMDYMGFVRYGVDHYVPGGEAGEVMQDRKELSFGASGNYNKRDENVTYHDNEPYYTKSEEYIKLRDEKMLKMLDAVEPDVVWDDYFHTTKLETNILKLIFGGEFTIETGAYGYNAEQFLQRLINCLELWVARYRSSYAEDSVYFGDTTYNTYQKALRDVMVIIMGSDADHSARMMERLSHITSCLSSIDLHDLDAEYLNLLGNWSAISGEKKQKLCTLVWKLISQTGMLEELGEDDRNNLQYDLPVLLDFLFRLVEGDFANGTLTGQGGNMMELLATFVNNGSRILFNHYPEINLAWVRSLDDYYKDETTPYLFRKPEQVPAPSAKGKYNTETVITAGGEAAEFKEQETILLDSEEIRGETIFYDLENLTTGKAYRNKVYRGGIDLGVSLEDHIITEYRLTAYAKSYDTASEKVTYNIHIIGKKHKVTVDYSENPDLENTTLYLEEGEENLLMARLPKSKFFTGWLVTDEQGRDVTELFTANGQEAGLKSSILSFVMPNPGEDGFSKFYELTFKPLYEDRIDNAKITLAAPEKAGDILSREATVVLRSGSKEMKVITVPVMWTFEHLVYQGTKLVDKYDVLTTKQAYNSTNYTAEILLTPELLGEALLTSGSFTASLDGAGVKCSKNSTEGKVLIRAAFPRTEAGDIWEKEPRKLTVEAWDLNLDSSAGEEYRKEYYVDPGSEDLTVFSPSVANEAFFNWSDPDGTGILEPSGQSVFSPILILKEMPDQDVTLHANYIPVVKRIYLAAYLPKAEQTIPLTAEEALQTAHFTVENEYEISSENIEVSWIPEPDDGKTYDFGKEYALTLSLVPDDDNCFTVKKVGSQETQKVKGAFLFDKETEIIADAINDHGAPEQNVQLAVELDEAYNKLSIQFPATEKKTANLRSIYWPKDLSDVPYTGSEAELQALLPKTVEANAKGCGPVQLPVEWKPVKKTAGPDDGSARSEWSAEGTVTLPEEISNRGNLDLTHTLKIYVDRDQRVKAPVASVDSGSFLYDKTVHLEADSEDVVIRYTLDGSDPKEGTVYDGTAILISREQADENGVVLLRAISRRDGSLNSAEAVYEYEFVTDVPVPTGAADNPKGETQLPFNDRQQTLVEGSPFFTLSGSKGVTITENGDAVAADAGVHTVTAHIRDGFKWALVDKEGNVTRTTEDQVLKVTVYQANILNAQISLTEAAQANGKMESLPAIQSVVVEDKVLKENVDYTVRYVPEGSGSKVRVEITGKGNFSGKAAVLTTKKMPAKPARVTLKKVKATNTLIAARWKNLKKNVSGYQILITNSKGKKVKKINVILTKSLAKKKQITKLMKRGKLKKGTYKVRVRAYNKKNGRTVYGKWSKPKKFKLKTRPN